MNRMKDKTQTRFFPSFFYFSSVSRHNAQIEATLSSLQSFHRTLQKERKKKRDLTVFVDSHIQLLIWPSHAAVTTLDGSMGCHRCDTSICACALNDFSSFFVDQSHTYSLPPISPLER